MKKLKISIMLLLYILSSIIFSSFNMKQVQANSASRYWFGQNAYGTLNRNENCPLIVEKEDLDFYLNFNSHSDEYVSAKYTFYNPTDMDIKVKVDFPYSDYHSNDDSMKYVIKSDGVELNKEIRYAYGDMASFKVDDVKKIKDDYDFKDEYKDLKLYSFDLKLYELQDCYYVFDVKGNYNVFYSDNLELCNVQQKGICYCLYNSYNTCNVVLKDDNIDDFIKNVSVYKDRDWKNVLLENPKIIVENKVELTYQDLVMKKYSDDYGISKIDWYNAFNFYVDVYKDSFIRNLNIRDRLIRYYEYELNVPSKSRVVNEVNAPLYPSLNKYYSPERVDYIYLLSPATTWSDFSNLKINIHTNKYLLESSISGFEKTEDGYTYKCDKLPDTELVFTVCEAKNPSRSNVNSSYRFIFIAIAVVMILPIIFAIIAIIAYCKKINKADKEKKKILSLYALETLFYSASIYIQLSIIQFAHSNYNNIGFYIEFILFVILDVYIGYRSKNYYKYICTGLCILTFIISIICNNGLIFGAMIGISLYSLICLLAYPGKRK